MRCYNSNKTNHAQNYYEVTKGLRKKGSHYSKQKIFKDIVNSKYSDDLPILILMICIVIKFTAITLRK